MSKFKIAISDPPGFKEVEYIKLFDEAGETWALHMSCDNEKYIVSHYKIGYQIGSYPGDINVDLAIIKARAFINYYEHRIIARVNTYPTLNES